MVDPPVAAPSRHPHWLSQTPRSLQLAVAAGAAYALFILWMLPAGIVALNDDFGYIRSVILTLQHHRPWTDDWLEPWSASLSAIAALLFRVTGNFYLATYGLLAFLGGWTFSVMAALIMRRGVPAASSLMITAGIVTFPTIFWKSLEFTGMALHIPCLLTCLWLAERRRWAAFVPFWLLAIANRQSAIAWGGLLVGALVADVGPKHGRIPIRRILEPIGAFVAAVLWYRFLAAHMNRTRAQLATTDLMWARWNWDTALADIGVVAGVAALAIGILGAVSAVFFGTSVRRPSVASFGARVAASALILCLIRVGPHDHVAFDHAAFDWIIGSVYLKVLCIIAAVGVLVGPYSVSLVPLFGAGASVVALTFRGEIWDYYLSDIIVLILFAFWPQRRSQPSGLGSPRPGMVLSLICIFAPFHLYFVSHFKDRLDRGWIVCSLGSRALSEGKLRPNQMSFVPFGLQGWYFFPYYIAHCGPGDDVADFGRYLEQNPVAIAWRFSKRLRFLPDHGGGLPADRSGAILGGSFPYFGIFSASVLLLRNPPSQVAAAKAPLPRSFTAPSFPTDNRGWRILAANAASPLGRW